MVARVLMLGAMAAALTHAQQLRNWANEEVRWIITDQDREQFNALQTDEQRTQFIDTFWARRDPTPGTPENEFRDEHYRRMQFANAQFRGWNTDRGLVYVRYGPP